MLTLLLMLAGCDSAPTEQTPAASVVSSDTTLTWLDDETIAQSVDHHRLAGRLRSPTVDEAALRKQARDALVARAKSLGFARLDNLQIDVGCTGTDDPAMPCEARFLAIASR